MKKERDSKSGYWLVFGIVLLLALPPIIGHFFLSSGSEATQQVSR